jgi:hypothetical protein
MELLSPRLDSPPLLHSFCELLPREPMFVDRFPGRAPLYVPPAYEKGAEFSGGIRHRNLYILMRNNVGAELQSNVVGHGPISFRELFVMVTPEARPCAPGNQASHWNEELVDIRDID